MTGDPLAPLEAPADWCVKLRDKLAPRYRMRLRTAYGDLPFDSADLVATQLRRGNFERTELSILIDVLPLCSSFVDVGANFGLFTLLAARRMAGGRVVAFEASAIEFDKLLWTVRSNNLANVTLLHCAVSDGDGEAYIFESLCGAGALNRLDRPGKPTGEWRRTRVEKTSLDQHFSSASHGLPIDLIKIDVEGHELPVLKGASNVLSESRPVVMIEVNPSRASELSTPEQIFAFMGSRGYRWFAIDKGAACLREADRASGAINYFAIPSSREDALVAGLLRWAGR